VIHEKKHPESQRNSPADPARDAALSDEKLVLAARDGERWALEALYRRYASMVNGLVFRLHPRDGDLDDIVQDIFISAFDSLKRIQNPQAFSAFLSSVAVRTTLKRLRRRAIATRLGLRPREAPPLEHVATQTASPEVVARAKELYVALETLPTEERLALLLRKVEGMSLEEIAERMSLSLATVKRRIANAEQRLNALRDGNLG
jgi:RNA polymerase sigma-70 factor, ECF subfamily